MGNRIKIGFQRSKSEPFIPRNFLECYVEPSKQRSQVGNLMSSKIISNVAKHNEYPDGRKHVSLSAIQRQ